MGKNLRLSLPCLAAVLGVCASMASAQVASTKPAFTPAASALAPTAAAGPLPAATAPAGDSAKDAGLLPLIPKDTFFFAERRGFDAVRTAFAASNLGKMAADEAVKQFANDSRVRVGQRIVQAIFDLSDQAEIDRHQKLLHQVLKPFAYRPAAMFAMLQENLSRAPAMGFLCLTGDYRGECQEALKALMASGLPPKGQPGVRQAFTYPGGAMVWQGLAWSHEDFTLPTDPKELPEALKDRSAILAAWEGNLLCVATGLSAADAISKSLTSAAGGGDTKAGLAVVLAKTAMKDWAFRWYLDAEKMVKAAEAAGGSEVKGVLASLGLTDVLGVGGTEGYADNVYTRLTFINAPKAKIGLTKLFKAGGSYQKALAMTPPGSTFLLAGEMDSAAVLQMIGDLAKAGLSSVETQTIVGPGPITNRPTSAPVLSDEAKKALALVKDFLDAGDGSISIFTSNLTGIMAMIGGGGPPVGAVFGAKDPAKAAKALEDLIGMAREDAATAAGSPAEPAKNYRNVPLRACPFGPMDMSLHLGIMKDRLVIAMNESPLKSALDAALDNTGGFAADGKEKKLADLAGDGSALFSMNLADLCQVVWPFLMQLSQQEDGFPLALASMPSVEKMARLLGPELAVIQPTPDGLLLKSRGQVPFATKTVLGFPFLGGLFFMWWI